jgi:aspartyl-tRNA(Asn)/glutamyl-tRNA(Gln) amidotransferase subunit C
MHLEKKDIKHIATLARLDLSEAELEKYGSQLSDVLNYIDLLQEVNTESIEPSAQITGLENIYREDKVKEWNDEERLNALNEAPEIEDGQLKVRRVL